MTDDELGRLAVEATPLTMQELIIAYYRKRLTLMVERYTEAMGPAMSMDAWTAQSVAQTMSREAQEALDHNKFDLWMEDELQGKS